MVTDDDMVIMASEVGVLAFRRTRSSRSGACSPAMLLIDLDQGRIIDDEGSGPTLANANRTANGSKPA